MYADYLVTKLNDFRDIVIPFFDKYPIQGVKSLDFNNLKKVFMLRENSNAIFTREEFEKIQQIKSGMNKGRIFVSDEGINKTLPSPSIRTLSRLSQATTSPNKRHYSTTRELYSSLVGKSQSNAPDQIKFNQ